MDKPKILICDDDKIFHMTVKHSLKGFCECKSAHNSEEALTILRNNKIDIVLLDIQMRTDREGLDCLPRIKELDPDVAVVMSSGLTDFAVVREAMRAGAVDYVPKGSEPDELKHAIDRVIRRSDLIRKCDQQNSEVKRTQNQHRLVGESKAINDLRKLISKLQTSKANILITGETGTGKEVVARQLRGNTVDGSLEPFISIDSSTIQHTTAESLLFGHEKGAFTGAEKSTKGIFEEANGGVVYFDEIANMSLDIQAKLLRVLQEKEVKRLGSNRILEPDFRVIAASNKDLDGMSRAGTFKEDLLQRLNVIPITIPPLRERKDDIPLLIEHFVKKHSPGAEGKIFTNSAVEQMLAYDWPGNVRELSNTIAYLLVMTETAEIDVADLPPKFRQLRPTTNTASDFYDRIACFERKILADEYNRMEGNVSKMALALNMDRSHLYTKLKEHGLHPKRATEGQVH